MPEDDADNYLSSLINGGGASPTKSGYLQLENMPSGGEQANLPLEDGYNSDESFSREFYLTMHDDVMQEAKEL